MRLCRTKEENETCNYLSFKRSVQITLIPQTLYHCHILFSFQQVYKLFGLELENTVQTLSAEPKAEYFITLVAVGHLVFPPGKRTLLASLWFILIRLSAENTLTFLTKGIQLAEHSLSLDLRGKATVASFNLTFNSSTVENNKVQHSLSYTHVGCCFILEDLFINSIPDMMHDGSWVFLFLLCFLKSNKFQTKKKS